MASPTPRLPWHILLIFALTLVVHYLDRKPVSFALPQLALFVLAAFCQSMFQGHAHATIQLLAGDAGVGRDAPRANSAMRSMEDA